jgi:aryl-phospho-beta-D-glucosidase BglC (GH1 family)
MRNAFHPGLFRFAAVILSIVLMGSIPVMSGDKVSADGSLILTLTQTNSWVESGKTHSQYSAKIENKGTASVSGWIITITVPKGSTMSSSDGWNGTYAISDTTLTITPKDYNKQIAAGAQTSDIGFILTTPGAVTLTGTVSSSGSQSSTQATDSQPSSTQTDNSSAPTQDDWLHTDGSKILDKNGTAVWLTGINWFGYNTGSNIFDGVWACNMKAALASIADHGFNLLRIPISAELVLDWKNGVYPTANFNQALNPELVGMNSLQIFDLAISTCKANGIKVMLDIHSAKTDSMGHLANLWYTDSISTQDYYDSLSFLAKHFANDDTVIAYDLKNEPHGKPGENGAIWNDSTSANNWKYVAETAGNLVLDANPNALIMIEGIEIYPKDISTNGNFTSTNSSDYYFDWWGGNLRGVKDYPIDFGSAGRNKQIVYSPHDYGPAVYAQPWFQSGFTYESLQTDCWNDNWLYISKENIAPLLIGEWGGYMTEPNLTWMTDMRKLILEYHLNHTFWCYNANSGDTGGLVKDDFMTWDQEKYDFVKEVLWQENGKFVGLDHVIALGQSGSGISLSEISGSAAGDAGTSGSSSATPSGSSSAKPSGSASVTSSDLTPTSAASASQSSGTQTGMSSTEIWIAAAAMILVLAGAAGTGYFVYTKKKKGDSKK